MKKRFFVFLCLAALVLSPVTARGKKGKSGEIRIGVSLSRFADNFLTSLREGMEDYAKELNVDLFVEDAKNDTNMQLSQVQNFIAQGYDAIIVNLVDTEASSSITKAAQDAGVPLVYVNRKPAGTLPDHVVYVGSQEIVAGREQAKVLAEKLGGKGNVVIMLGELSHTGTRGRTKGDKEIFAKYPGIKIIEEQTANWERVEALNLMSNWLQKGVRIDAVAANNDEMALGAIKALENAGLVPNKDVFVGGVDATADALDAMAKGKLTVTVFQDAVGQGRGSIDAALKLIKKESVEPIVWVPFKPVTPENYKEFKK